MDDMITVYIWDELKYFSGTAELWAYGPMIPTSTTQVPPTPGEGEWVIWNGYTWALTDQPPTPPVPVISPDQVDAERDRRIAQGFVFEGVLFSTATNSQQMDIIGKLADATAAILIDEAQPQDYTWSGGEMFAWAAADNTMVPMDAQTCLNFTRTAIRRKEALIAAALRLKAENPIPVDYYSDAHWPELQVVTSKTSAR
ncbi:MAG: DUF4376 domain-containing protein [Pseudomonas oryzihabitans]|uniref:DUF4376 domain-containing protein n=1 Tax=Pseudomonas oryzihabitans TaxID=47885 RepID=UPI002913A830|nr:DUF4376 domain-containing protein [Pseudomonas oryzihabitans]MDU4059447.1 DUF4376 domain-containing protein [Pseudomonas oryzihabitans]